MLMENLYEFKVKLLIHQIMALLFNLVEEVVIEKMGKLFIINIPMKKLIILQLHLME